MRVLAPGLYELDPDERFTVRIDCEGGAFLAFGNVNNFELRFDEDAPQASVTPALLAGPQSVNRVHLHLVYPQDAPPERYRVTVLDQHGVLVDSESSTLNPDRPRPYRVDVDMVARVR
jgi:hypothetical protein